MTNYTLHLGDCLTVLKTIADNSIESVVCDPPYELSNDGKQSASSVFLEFAFPQNAKIEAHVAGSSSLSFFIGKVLDLSRKRAIPSPSTAVPVVSMALDNDAAIRDDDVENAAESAVPVSEVGAVTDIEPHSPEHLGCFSFKLTDATKLTQVLNDIGTGFTSGGIGIGFAGLPASVPSLIHRLSSVVLSENDIGLCNGSLTDLIGTLTGTTGIPVLSFDLGRNPVEQITANGARLLATVLLLSGAELVRADAATSGLPSMLEARRICVVDDFAHRAFSFDIIFHPQSISSMGFMGKKWDGTKIAYNVAMWAECLRVLKPGGHLLAFSGSRTYHRMTCAIEDAGFEIRDQIMWVYGSGFPKSLDVSKAIDKAGPSAGVPFADFGEHYEECRKSKGLSHSQVCAAGGWHGATNHGGSSSNWANGYGLPTLDQWQVLQPLLDLGDKWKVNIEREQYERKVVGTQRGNLLAVAPGQDNDRSATELDITAPATEAARQWQGWGTALKPAHEPICVARKPLAKGCTVASNVLAHGTGALNIDGCRVNSGPVEIHTRTGTITAASSMANVSTGSTGTGQFASGRWPANLIHDGSDEVAAAFPQAHAARIESDKSAARFFYCAKASRKDRDEGLAGFALQAPIHGRADQTGNSKSLHISNSKLPSANIHPTVKPTDLMAYLCRLVTPSSGTVLDPFMGSGSTGKAAIREGFKFIGIEMEPQYMEIATARIEHELRRVQAAETLPQKDLFDNSL